MVDGATDVKARRYPDGAPGGRGSQRWIDKLPRTRYDSGAGGSATGILVGNTPAGRAQHGHAPPDTPGRRQAA